MGKWGKQSSEVLFTDVLIVEDDPYYFLQVGEYAPKMERVYTTQQAVEGADEEAAYIASLAPSFLK